MDRGRCLSWSERSAVLPDSVTPPGHKATDVTPLLQVDDGGLLNQLPVWAPDEATRKKILVDNPARLYGF